MLPLLPLATTTGPQRFTLWWIFLGIVAALALDVWLTVNRYADDTISFVTLKVSLEHPVVAAALMILMGHLLIPTVQTRDLPAEYQYEFRLMFCVFYLWLGSQLWGQRI